MNLIQAKFLLIVTRFFPSFQTVLKNMHFSIIWHLHALPCSIFMEKTNFFWNFSWHEQLLCWMKIHNIPSLIFVYWFLNEISKTIWLILCCIIMHDMFFDLILIDLTQWLNRLIWIYPSFISNILLVFRRYWWKKIDSQRIL